MIVIPQNKNSRRQQKPLPQRLPHSKQCLKLADQLLDALYLAAMLLPPLVGALYLLLLKLNRNSYVLWHAPLTLREQRGTLASKDLASLVLLVALEDFWGA
ncbi:MAG: hypothetical protein ROO73_05585 [Roseivirga sp.]